MTIQREYRDGPFVIQCDTCNDVEELEGITFADALGDAKERGYRAFRQGQHWQHICGECDT